MAFKHNSVVADDEPTWGEVDKDRLPRVAFADEGEADKVSTWKYPHHWVEGGGNPDEDGRYTTGTLRLHRGGLASARQAAGGARSGQKAPAEVIAHLNGHAEEIGMGEKQNAVLMAAEIPVVRAGRVPEWVQIAEVGLWRGHPQGTQRITEQDLRTALEYFNAHYQAHGKDVVIDYGHATTSAMLGVPAKAAGWISEMELRAGGAELWGKVMWTTEAAQSIGAREYRYVSPVFQRGALDRVTGAPVQMVIPSVALTNSPFLTELAALNTAGQEAVATDGDGGAGHDAQTTGEAADEEETMTLLEQLASALGKAAADVAPLLGVDAGADDAAVAGAILAAVEQAGKSEPSPEGEAAPVSAEVANALGVAPGSDATAVRAAILRLRAASEAPMATVRARLGLADDAGEADVLNSIDALRQDHRRSEAEVLVDAAVEAGKVPPALRDFWLNSAVAEIDAAREALKGMPVIGGPSGLGGRKVQAPGGLTEAERAMAKRLHVSEETMLRGKQG